MPVHYDKDGKIAYMTIDRPEKMNSFDSTMVEQFETHIRTFALDDEALVLILTGAGEKAFCAGIDVAEGIPGVLGPAPVDPPLRRIITLKGVELFKPIVAAVNGYCLGGGLEMLMGTDIRIACPEATFALPEVRWGITARGGGTVRLPRQIPWAVAMEMILMGDSIDAERAYQLGLINRVVPRDDLLSTAEMLAHRVCRNGPIAVRCAKESAMRTSGASLSQAYEIDYRLVSEAYRSEDAKEGPRAFREGREPRFEGR
jgi:enoyl-CoA hydratase